VPPTWFAAACAQRRVDISKLSPVGLSHNMARFSQETEQVSRLDPVSARLSNTCVQSSLRDLTIPPPLQLQYLRTFVETFGAVPLRTQAFEWAEGRGRGPPAFCWLRALGCTYL
jgi:hypothetical protein